MNPANAQQKDVLGAPSSAGHELAMSLRRAYMALHRSTNGSLVEFGLTADQFVVLATLEEHGSMTQTELTQRTFSDRNTISAMLSRLQDLEYVERKRLKTDGRFRVVSLTRRGRSMLNKSSKATDEIRQRLTRQFKVKSLNEIIARLNDVAALLEEPNSSSMDAEK